MRLIEDKFRNASIGLASESIISSEEGLTNMKNTFLMGILALLLAVGLTIFEEDPKEEQTFIDLDA